MSFLKVDLGERSYQIVIDEGILKLVGDNIRKFNFSKRCLLVSNKLVAGYYGDTVQASLEAVGFQPLIYKLPEGEEAKKIKYADELWQNAITHGLDRNSAVIALGGGVVGDTAGFVASTYMRGVPFIQIPTTLLAQVDSSVGGKVAINHPLGKNIIGAFYQPRLVFTDLKTLHTLPREELLAGLAEVIKYGVVWDADFFDFLEEYMEEILAYDIDCLKELVMRSCAIKSQVVAQDEKEGGLRAILNFGHTIGHALETLTGYQRLRHGEAVAIGMAQAAKIALKAGLLPAEDCQRLLSLIERSGLSVAMPDYLHVKEITKVMLRDKKNKNGTITMILPRKIGAVEIVHGLAEEDIQNYFLTGEG